ncbi:MAG: hypothetical protein KBG80_07315 [Breznakibacter sp.]|nr:hypothetical protein [Breznakibacter sp.]
MQPSQNQFIIDIKENVRRAQYDALKALNTHLINLYWELGKEILEKQRLGWEKAIVPTLSKELQLEFPNIGGFSTTNLWYMVQLYTDYHKDKNLQPLVGDFATKSIKNFSSYHEPIKIKKPPSIKKMALVILMFLKIKLFQQNLERYGF